MCNYAQRVQLTAGVGIIALMLVGFKRNEEKPETVTEKTVLKSDVNYEFSRSVGAGRIVKKQEGKDGSITKVFRVVKKDGKAIKELIREERIDAVHTLYHLGKGGYNPSRGSFKKTRTLTMRASAYEPGPGSNGKWAFTTTLGVKPKYGIVAVDPKTIKLGSLLFVEGYGFAYAADTGGAIKGDRIDLCFSTESECQRFGRKKVTVHVLSSGK
jgi:3D (Asp-Asp-Asp) domain-containing protein